VARTRLGVVAAARSRSPGDDTAAAHTDHGPMTLTACHARRPSVVAAARTVGVTEVDGPGDTAVRALGPATAQGVT
jgi:hypothetical protein